MIGTQPSLDFKNMIAGLYNRKTGKILPVESLVFHNPEPNINPIYERDTLVQAAYELGSGYLGKKRFYYNRISLSTLPNTVTITLSPVGDLYSNLEALNEALGITITEDDVDNATIVGDLVEVTAKLGSFMYTGSKTIQLLQ